MAASSPPDFLVHEPGDAVGVAIRPLSAGPAVGRYLTGTDEVHVDVHDEIPLGHKIALTDLDGDVDVIEYGQRVALTREPITRGSHVHTHNVRSARWQTSIAD